MPDSVAVPTAVQVVMVTFDVAVATVCAPPVILLHEPVAAAPDGIAQVASSRRNFVVPDDPGGSGTRPFACDAPLATISSRIAVAWVGVRAVGTPVPAPAARPMMRDW